MENLTKKLKYQQDSHVLITLNKQIEALNPIRISYENLQRYHEKIERDLYSLIEQHDYAISSLRSNVQNLILICTRTQAQRNDLIVDLKDRQNDLAKLILDNKNIAQKYQSLNQKYQLQANRTQQNKSYQIQLQNILQNIKTHISNVQILNRQLQNHQSQIKKDNEQVDERVQVLQGKKLTLLQENQRLKQRISRLNVNNDDLVDGNRKSSNEIRQKQNAVMTRVNLNIEEKQKLIELRSELQKWKNQSEYKSSLIIGQQTTKLELTVHKDKLQTIISDNNQQKLRVYQENANLQAEINVMKNQKRQNTLFKTNSQNHLVELKKSNELLLSKMQHFCLQDREVENLLIRKITSLQFFSSRLNQIYEVDQLNNQVVQFDIKNQIIFKEKSINLTRFTQFDQNITKIFNRSQANKSEGKKQTKSSEKSWIKENLC